MIELLGLLLPPLIELINKKVTDSTWKFWISVVVCAIFGVLINFFTHGNHLGSQDDVAKSILAVFAASQISFKTVWENSQMREKINPNQ